MTDAPEAGDSPHVLAKERMAEYLALVEFGDGGAVYAFVESLLAELARVTGWQDGEASNADLAATLRRWCKPYPAGECCMCQQPPDEACDEECRVPTLMLIANRLDPPAPSTRGPEGV